MPDPNAGGAESESPGGERSERSARRALGRVLARLRASPRPLWLALALVAAVRLLPFPAVYRRGDVVLSSNDPYFYRHLVARVSGAASSALDLPALLGAPELTANGEPLLVATLALVAALFGGGDWVVGTTLAWYPVVSALATAVAVYALATRLSGDRRVGVAAVALFAVVPGHAFRTGLGFADHHAFDYPLLAVTALSFVALATREVGWPWDRRTVALAGLLAVGTAGQVLAWEAGPLLLVPLAVGVALAGPLAVAHGRIEALAPVVAGVAVGGALALAAHAVLGWQSLAVAVVPALVAGGAAAVFVGAAAAARLDRSPVLLVGAEVVGLALLAGVAGTAAPELVGAAERGVAFLTRSTAIGEMQSLLDRWGPLFGPLVMLGFTPFLAIPAMCWALWQVGRERVGWLLLSPYAWTFLALSLVQRRFTGEFAAFAAVFGGFGLLALLGWLDLTRAPGLERSPRPQPGTDERPGAPVAEADGGPETGDGGGREAPAVSGRVRVGMVGSLAAVLLGFPAAYSAEIHTRLTIDPRKHDAARAMAAHADASGWSYPRSYVFSEWGRNRMYNHFVSGESESYTFARRNYGSFLRADDPVGWYERLRGRVGFVVTTGEAGGGFLSRMQGRLHDATGSRVGDTPGLAHYRAVYASEDGFVKAFTLVPGARLEGSVDTAEPTTVPVRTEVSVAGGGGPVTYERLAETDAGGAFAVTVANPGEYRVGDRRVTVPEEAVVAGETVRVK
jgi:dolichyl-diphosphooligosaccharide--protein glycosyltransferase